MLFLTIVISRDSGVQRSPTVSFIGLGTQDDGFIFARDLDFIYMEAEFLRVRHSLRPA